MIVFGVHLRYDSKDLLLVSSRIVLLLVVHSWLIDLAIQFKSILFDLIFSPKFGRFDEGDLESVFAVVGLAVAEKKNQQFIEALDI